MRLTRSRSYKTSANFLAGWMFADLLLALSVIFLATISFQSEKIISTSPEAVFGISGEVEELREAKEIGEETSQIEFLAQGEGLRLEYSEFNPDQIRKDIESYLLKNYSSINYEAIYLQAIGGYDEVNEQSDMGSLRAMDFVINLRKAQFLYTKRASIDISTSANIESGKTVLRIVFARSL